MEAIQLTVSIPRYVLTKAIGPVYPPVFWGHLAMLRYRDVPEPVLPGPGWVKIKTRYGGICGSDLHTIFLKDSPSLSAFVSSPLTLGHENLGTITQVGEQVQGFASGDRVVADPLLPCATRGFEEPCEFCRREEFAQCQNFAEGDLAPGLSIGHCPDTGGSWSPCFVAHQSQLFSVPENVSDENAALAEPFAGALHWVMRNLPGDDDTILILGAGVVGLCTLVALRALGSGARAIVLAKYPFQGEMARRFGADQVIYLREGDYFQALAEATGGRLYKPAGRRGRCRRRLRVRGQREQHRRRAALYPQRGYLRPGGPGRDPQAGGLDPHLVERVDGQGVRVGQHGDLPGPAGAHLSTGAGMDGPGQTGPVRDGHPPLPAGRL